MSDRRRGDGSEKVTGALPNFSEFTGPDFIKITASVVNSWSQVNSHLIALAQTSLQNNFAAAEELRQVQSPKELVEVQLRMARKAYDDYMDEAAKIGQIVQRMSTEALEALTTQKSA